MKVLSLVIQLSIGYNAIIIIINYKVIIMAETLL